MSDRNKMKALIGYMIFCIALALMFFCCSAPRCINSGVSVRGYEKKKATPKGYLYKSQIKRIKQTKKL